MLHTPVAKSRDVLNTGEIKEWLATLSTRKSKEFKLWLSRNVYNWLVREYQGVRMVTSSKFYPLMTMIAGLMGKDENNLPVHWVKPSEAPDWLQAKLDDGSIVLYVLLSPELSTTLLHCWDYVRAELKGEDLSRHAVPDMIRASEEWTKRLARIKISNKDLAEVEVIAKYPEHQLVRLVTKGNYALEGRRMHNCVASYYDEKEDGVSIYSYRTLDNTPVFTIQLNSVTFNKKVSLVMDQVMGRYPSIEAVRRNSLGNRPLSSEELGALVSLLQQPNLFGKGVRFIADLETTSSGFQAAYYRAFGGDEEDDDDDEWDDEDDGDEDEDDEDEDGPKEETEEGEEPKQAGVPRASDYDEWGAEDW